MKKIVIPIILFICISMNAFAEDKSGKEKRGDKYYFVYSYDKAIVAYTEAKELTPDGQRKLAISYHNMDRNPESELAYAKLIATAGVLPEDYYNYSMLLKSSGKYDEANKQMDKFSEMKPGDLRAKDYAANKSSLVNLQTDDGTFKPVPMTANTDAQDFGTSYYKNQIVFASSRTSKLFPRKSKRNGKPYLNIYVTDVENGQLKDPDNFDKSLNLKFNNGPASFSKDGNFMAFTENNYDLKRKDKVVKLEIYFRTYADGKWSKPEPFNLNNKEYSVGHPCLSADGKSMYFVSDMPGGFGGTDIYRIKKDDKGQWGKAQNVGDQINTEGDEMFPFFEEKNSVLFFASNGRFGLGGLDIFIAPIQGTQVGLVYNPGSPLNTTADDFALMTDENLTKGYFSSNRADGKGDDDIYGADISKPLHIGKTIKGIAKDKDSKAIPKTFITLMDDKGKTIDTITTKDDGAYTFLVESDKNYKLTGKKTNYLDGETLASTTGKEYIVIADVTLLQKEEPVVVKEVPIAEKIKVNADLGKIADLNPIYFDLNKYNIRPDAEKELAKIVKVMNEYPDMVVELGAYTDCRETVKYNQVLSDNRAKASAAYIKQRITKPGRISGKGYGKTKYVNSCGCNDNVGASCSEDEHQKNRRTEFIITKNIVTSSK